MSVEQKPHPAPEEGPDETSASPEEAAEAIRGLSVGERARLLKVAQFYWQRRIQGGPRGWEAPEDLLQEAVARTLEGSRRWPHSVSIVKFLAEVMRSISSDLAAKRTTGLRLVDDAVEDLEPGDRADVGAGPVGSSVADVAIAREELRRIERLFEGDDEALAVLRCRAQEYSASETQAHLGITKKRYDTVQKRIRRKFNKYTEEEA